MTTIAAPGKAHNAICGCDNCKGYEACYENMVLPLQAKLAKLQEAPGLRESVEDALDEWWFKDHFGESCEVGGDGAAHSEDCVSTAFRDGYAKGGAALNRGTTSPDLEAIRARNEFRKPRDSGSIDGFLASADIDALLAEVERLRGLLDDLPVVTAKFRNG